MPRLKHVLCACSSSKMERRNHLKKAHGRKEIILRSNSPWGFCPFHHPDSPNGQVVRVSGELLPCMTRGSSHRPLRLLTGSPSMPHEPKEGAWRVGSPPLLLLGVG